MLLLIFKIAVRIKINRMISASEQYALQIGQPAYRMVVNCSFTAGRFQCDVDRSVHKRYKRGNGGGILIPQGLVKMEPYSVPLSYHLLCKLALLKSFNWNNK